MCRCCCLWGLDGEVVRGSRKDFVQYYIKYIRLMMKVIGDENFFSVYAFLKTAYRPRKRCDIIGVLSCRLTGSRGRIAREKKVDCGGGRVSMSIDLTSDLPNKYCLCSLFVNCR